MAESKPGLKVIGAGAGRTGTSSLQQALDILGLGPCYHMKDVIRKKQAGNWISVLKKSPTREDWDSIFGDSVSTLDFPSCVMYKELLEAYPEAKVILTVRDPAGWAKSVNDTIWSPKAGELSLMQAPWRPDFQRMARLVRTRFFNDGYGGFTRLGGRPSDEKMIAAFEAWNKKVVESLPSEKVLVFQMKDGWGPLCKFLNVPVPDKPFPHANDTEAFKKFRDNKWKEARDKNVKVLGALAGIATAVMIAVKVMRSK